MEYIYVLYIPYCTMWKEKYFILAVQEPFAIHLKCITFNYVQGGFVNIHSRDGQTTRAQAKLELTISSWTGSAHLDHF